MTITRLSVIVFIAVLTLNVCGVFLDFVLLLCRQQTISQHAWQRPWIGAVIVTINIIGVEAIAFHFLCPPLKRIKPMPDVNACIPQSGLTSDLTAWLSGDLGSAVVRLYTQQVGFSPTNTAADYTEAAWPGYAPITPPPWGAPYVNSEGKAQVDASSLIFRANMTVGTYTAWGMYLTDPGGGTLLAVFPFLGARNFTPEDSEAVMSLSMTVVSEQQTS
jgi:hypothetical protein